MCSAIKPYLVCKSFTLVNKTTNNKNNKFMNIYRIAWETTYYTMLNHWK